MGRASPQRDRDRTGPDDPPCFVPAENPSPLIMATASGHEAVALFLLEHGADPKAAGCLWLDGRSSCDPRRMGRNERLSLQAFS